MSNKLKHYHRFNEVYEDPYEFFCNYLDGNITLFDIQKKCMEGKLNSETRSFIYKILLNILPYDNPKIWKNKVKEQRNIYYTKLNDLLSQNEYILQFINCHAIKGTKVYEELFALIPPEQKELLSLIKLDIDRTFQDSDLFHNNKIKEMLTKILYVHSTDHPHPSYCQGMNEILGTLFISFFPSVRYNKYTNEEIEKENNDNITNKEMLYYYLIDDEYLESDLYLIYNEIMSRELTLLYSYNDDKYKVENKDIDVDLNNLTIEYLNNSKESKLMKRIKKIFYIYLKTDQEYYELLYKNIEPNLFLLRWILCVLNREISLKNILWVWDTILFYEFVEFTFQNNNNNNINENKEEEEKVSHLNFLDIICLSMIFDLKKDIINSEPSIILSKFLKYPNEKNIKNIMKEAIKLSNNFNERKDIWNNEEIKNFKLNKTENI